MAVVREDVVQIGFDIDMGELGRLTRSLDDIEKAFSSGIGDDAFDEMIKESKRASEGVDDVKNSFKGINGDGLDDCVKGLKDTDKQGKQAHEQLKKIANTGFEKTISGLKGLSSQLGTIGLKAGKLLAKGMVAGAAGVGALVTKSVMGYADYEQLVGGVDTLFKDATLTVQKNARRAFMTAGLSENAYMETATSFSASLIQSLGGDVKKAAEYAHTAIVDMSDNANKMGTDMESLIQTYQSLSRGNYAMLDNLKLGYGGTKEELERLLKDAEAISGLDLDVSSYSDIVQAIHVIQEEMGIAGTTAKEANETISGSFAALKGAWSNTLTALVIGGDVFDRSVDDLIEAAKTFGKNIMPAIIKGLKGVGSLIGELAPVIEKELPGLIDSLLPPLIKAATAVVKGVIIALPDIIKTVGAQLPEILGEIWDGIVEAFGDVPGVKKAENFFKDLKDFFTDNVGTIKRIIPALIGFIGAFKLFTKFKGLTGLFGGKSGLGGSGGLFSGFSSLSKLNPVTILKGIGNLTLILGGFGALAAAIMWVSPYMAQLSDLKSVFEVLVVTGAVGLLGTALTKLSSTVGYIPVTTVLKGLADIAIVMVGFGALTAALMWLAPYISELSDMKTTLKVLFMITAVGLIGAGLAALAGVIGLIPIPVVVSGLADIALALGGFTAIVAAFGALTQIDGFEDFIDRGAAVLIELSSILGEVVGSFIGNIGVGISNSLPAIGDNLSAFAESIEPMFKTFETVDTSGLADFAGAFAAFIAVIAGEKIISVITGGIDYAELGRNLTSFATNVEGFFKTVNTIEEDAFPKATELFNCLANIDSLPKEGGVVGWFQGEVDYAKMAEGLNHLAGAAGFFTTYASIPQAGFDGATKLFECLAGIKALPKDGGVAGWFAGEVNFEKIADGLTTLSGNEMLAAFTSISQIPVEAFKSVTDLFNALAGVQGLPSEGGIFGWFTGESSTTLSNIASELPGIGTSINQFFSNVGSRTDFSAIGNLFNTLNGIKIDTDVANQGFLSLGKSKLEEMGQGLSAFTDSAKSFYDRIYAISPERVTAFFELLDGLNTKVVPLNNEVLTSVANDLNVFAASTKEFTTSLYSFDPDTVNAFLGTLETLGGMDETVGDTGSKVLENVQIIATELSTQTAAMHTTIKDCVHNMASEVKNQHQAFKTSGQFMMQGLNAGIASMEGALMATARRIANNIKSTIDSAMEVNSPSRVMFETGSFIGQGLELGMLDTVSEIQGAAFEMSMAADPYFGSYSPDSDSGNIYNSGGNSEYTTISPVFNLSVTDTQNDRVLARKIKRFISEGIDEAFESIGRNNPNRREA